MKLVCPICNSKYTLEDACREQMHREMNDLAAFLGPHWHLAGEYVDCFRVTRCRSVSLKKQKRLLDELKSLFERKEFSHDGKRYKVTLPQLIEGLKITANAEKHGFQNHNYLKTVLVNSQEAARISAEGLTAAEERKREEKRREGRPQGRGDRRRAGESFGSPEPVAPTEAIDAAEYKKQKGIRSLVDQIGKDV